MSANLTTHAALLKEYYDDMRVYDMAVKNQPLVGLLERDENFTGKHKPVPIITSNPQGASATFATAVTNASATESDAFLLTTINDYVIANISRRLIKQSGSAKGAWLEGAVTEIDGAIKQARRRLGKQLYRSKGGAIGAISNASPTTTINLTNKYDAHNFERNMVIVLSTANGGGTVKTGTAKITAVNIEGNSLTVDTSLAAFTPAGAAADFIFVEGDYDATCSGLADWLPTTAPSATAFFGVDRSVEPDRLGGVRFNASAAGSNINHEEAIIELVGRVHAHGGSTSVGLVNPVDYRIFKKQTQAKLERTDVQNNAKISYRGILLDTDVATIPIVPDVNCPQGLGYFLDLETWKLTSSGPACDIFDKENDQEMLRVANADSYEARVGGYYQLECNAPGYNGVVQFQASTL